MLERLDVEGNPHQVARANLDIELVLARGRPRKELLKDEAEKEDESPPMRHRTTPCPVHGDG